VRERVCAHLRWLGVELDSASNAADAQVVSTPASATTVLVLPTNEEWMLARHTAELI
jgi:acetate kinase